MCVCARMRVACHIQCIAAVLPSMRGHVGACLRCKRMLAVRLLRRVMVGFRSVDTTAWVAVGWAGGGGWESEFSPAPFGHVRACTAGCHSNRSPPHTHTHILPRTHARIYLSFGGRAHARSQVYFAHFSEFYAHIETRIRHTCGAVVCWIACAVRFDSDT